MFPRLLQYLKPLGSRGGVSSSPGLHFGQGIPAPPHEHACAPVHGLSGWFSQTQPQSSQTSISWFASARPGLSFHSTSRITLRRFIRSSECTTSLLSSTASRRSTVRFASPRYSPKMRLASSTARMMVSWSGLFMTVTQLHESGDQDWRQIFVPVWCCGFMSRRLSRPVAHSIHSRVGLIKPARLGRASHQAWMASGRTRIIDPSPASGSAGHRPPLPCRERPRRRTLPQRRRRGRPRRPLSVVFRACSPG